KVALFALVIVGGCPIVRVNACCALVPTPLLAVNVSVYVPMALDGAVPLRVPVPLPLSTNVTPLGSVPIRAMDGGGNPLVVTVNVPGCPQLNVVLLALVSAG